MKETKRIVIWAETDDALFNYFWYSEYFRSLLAH